jgi:DNA-binding SARP family transcriptional activator
MNVQAAAASPTPIDEDVRVSVLGSFGCRLGNQLQPTLGRASQRLLAFLVLRHRPVTRGAAAGTLWPDVSEPHALSSLRSALARLDPISRKAVVVSDGDLCLADDVVVNLREAQALAHRLLNVTVKPNASDVNAAAVGHLSMELLPDWYDDWILIEAESWRQLRLNALEALAQHLMRAERFGEGTAAALAAVNAEPLRESARRTLVALHLADGNQSEAIAEFERYRAYLRVELGVEPTDRFRELVPVAHA